MLLLWSALLMSAPTNAPSCTSLNDKVLSKAVRHVQTEQDQAKQMDALASLGAYWDTVCPKDQFNASPETVRTVAGLLKIPRSRWVVTSVLFDIGPSLRSALNELRLAQSDQIKTDARTRAQAAPFPVTNDGVLATSLSCLARKARTNFVDDRLCRFLSATASER